MATVVGTAWHQRRHECFHLTRPVTTVIVAMYIAWQQWCRQAQRFQWGFAKGSIVGDGQQQNLEQRSSYKYFSSYKYIMSLGPPRHFSAAMRVLSVAKVACMMCCISVFLSLSTQLLYSASHVLAVTVCVSLGTMSYINLVSPLPWYKPDIYLALWFCRHTSPSHTIDNLCVLQEYI